jgi:hypothetical protein
MLYEVAAPSRELIFIGLSPKNTPACVRTECVSKGQLSELLMQLASTSVVRDQWHQAGKVDEVDNHPAHSFFRLDTELYKLPAYKT